MPQFATVDDTRQSLAEKSKTRIRMRLSLEARACLITPSYGCILRSPTSISSTCQLTTMSTNNHHVSHTHALDSCLFSRQLTCEFDHNLDHNPSLLRRHGFLQKRPLPSCVCGVRKRFCGESGIMASSFHSLTLPSLNRLLQRHCSLYVE